MTAKLSIVDTKATAKAEVLEEAKAILELAESGELVDLAWAAARIDGSIHCSFTGTSDHPRRLAAVSRLLHKLHTAVEE
jgi:hypothetical protein